MTKWLLKTFTTYRGNFYRPGEELDLTEEEVNSYPLKALVDRGHLVKAGESNVEEKEDTPLEQGALEEIDGIGPTYAEEIVDQYKTVDKLVEAGPERISEEVSGVDLEKAEEIIEVYRNRVPSIRGTSSS